MRVQHEVEDFFRSVKPDVQNIMNKLGTSNAAISFECGVVKMALEDGNAVHYLTFYPATKEHTEYEVRV